MIQNLLKIKKFSYIITFVFVTIALVLIFKSSGTYKKTVGEYDNTTLVRFINCLDRICVDYKNDSSNIDLLDNELNMLGVYIGYMNNSPHMKNIAVGIYDIGLYDYDDLNQATIEEIKNIKTIFENVKNEIYEQNGDYRVLTYKYFSNKGNIEEININIEKALNK